VYSVQSGVSQHQSATEDAAISSNMSVRSAAAAAAEVHSDTSSSSDTHRSRHVNSRSSPDSAVYRDVIRSAAANAVALLAIQFAARPA